MSVDAINNETSPLYAQVLQFCFAFTWKNFPAVLRRIALPLAVGGVTLFALLSLYLSQLAAYLENPAGSIASRVLGVASVGVLVMLLLHSVVVTSIAEIVLGRKFLGQFFGGFRQLCWRVYVTNLRLFLVMGSWGLILWFADKFLAIVGSPPTVKFGAIAFFAMGLVWFFLRAWFFVLPVCLETMESRALSRSWRLSAGYLRSIVAIIVPIALVAAVFQKGGEVFLSETHFVEWTSARGSFSADVFLFREYLGPIVLLAIGSYALTAILTTAARLYAYAKVVR